MSKLCSGCGNSLPLTSFYESKGKPLSKCKGCIKLKNKQWRNSQGSENLKLRQNSYFAKYYKKHKKRINRKNAEYISEKRKTDIQFKLHCNIGNLLRDHLRKLRVSKSSTTEKLLGYTIENLKEHIEAQFIKGMSWENYGKVWHIDHITPICSFDIADITDASFRKCWSLANLRPLFKEENLKKSCEDKLLSCRRSRVSMLRFSNAKQDPIEIAH